MKTAEHLEKNCQRRLEQLCEYMDGELGDALCVEFERHLRECHDCRIVLDTLEKTVILYRRFNQAELPQGTRERLHSALSEAGCL